MKKILSLAAVLLLFSAFTDKPAYQLFNLKLDYAFTGFLEGMHMLVMYVYKENINNSEPDVIFNRSNFHQINFITNFEF